MNKKKLYKMIVMNLRKHGAKKIAVFGSYARSKQKKKSDIDILVEFLQKKSLLEIVKIERELSESLGIKVDLLTEKAISPYIMNHVKKEMQVIYK